MDDTNVVLITGVSGYWGSRIASKLLSANEGGEGREYPFTNVHVIGLDAEPPEDDLKGLDFIQADIRNPLFVEILRTEQVDVIIHLAFQENYFPNEKAFDFNVIGTMKVLGAASEAGVHKVILRSSTEVYGANPTNPAFLTEQDPLNGNKNNGSIQNLIEIESFVNGFRQQMQEMVVTVLRFASAIGPNIDSPMTRFLQHNPPFTLFGFDPLMQVIHENDVEGAILFALENDVQGVFNIAAEGILPLGKLLGLAGRFPFPVPHFCAYWGNHMLKFTDYKFQQRFPIEPDYLRYPWVTDLAAMRETMGFIPTYTAEEALREFAGHLRLEKYKSDLVDMTYDEERLRDTLERRRRIRQQQDLQNEQVPNE